MQSKISDWLDEGQLSKMTNIATKQVSLRRLYMVEKTNSAATMRI
jgi:hypothetical protein